MAEKKLSNDRQIPSKSSIIREKDYCDLLYAWLQTNSERIELSGVSGRRIDKKKVKWQSIEKHFTRVSSDGSEYKVMNRKTIAKYFKYLEEIGLVALDEKGEYYNLILLNPEDANLIDNLTIMKLLNVFQRNSVNIYMCILNNYYSNGQKPFILTIRQIKDFIGIATTTTSNNGIVDDTIEILKRLKLLDYQMVYENEKSYFQFKWVKRKLPELEP